jgi:AraC-like DNA-binding protein
MAYREQIPHAALRPFVDRLWVRTAASAPEPPLLILPDGCIDLLLDLRGGKASAVGTMTRARAFVPRGPTSIAAVRFRPGGAVPFLRLSAHELTDRVVAGDDLGLDWTPPVGEGADALTAVRALERALLARLGTVAPPDPLVAFAVAALFDARPPTVDALARRIGWTRQHLRRALRQQVGVGAKTLGRVARLQRAVDRLQRGAEGLAGAAAALGYFDQAHMSRDFQALAGRSPAQVRGAAGSIFPIRSLLAGG